MYSKSAILYSLAITSPLETDSHGTKKGEYLRALHRSMNLRIWSSKVSNGLLVEPITVAHLAVHVMSGLLPMESSGKSTVMLFRLKWIAMHL